MKPKTLRITYVNFDDGTAVALSRDPGALICAEIHQLTNRQLATVVAIANTSQISDGAIRLATEMSQPLSVFGITPEAIFDATLGSA